MYRGKGSYLIYKCNHQKGFPLFHLLYFKAFGASERALECYNKADADLNLSRADVEKQRMNSNIKRQQVMIANTEKYDIRSNFGQFGFTSCCKRSKFAGNSID